MGFPHIGHISVSLVNVIVLCDACSSFLHLVVLCLQCTFCNIDGYFFTLLVVCLFECGFVVLHWTFSATVADAFKTSMDKSNPLTRYEWHHQGKMAAIIFRIVWLHFCTVRGRGDLTSIFIFISVEDQNQHPQAYIKYTKVSSCHSFRILL